MLFKSHKYTSFQMAEFKVINTSQHLLVPSSIIYFQFYMRVLIRIHIRKTCIYLDTTPAVKCHLGFGCSTQSCAPHKGLRAQTWKIEGVKESCEWSAVTGCVFKHRLAFGGGCGDCHGQYLCDLGVNTSLHFVPQVPHWPQPSSDSRSQYWMSWN